MGPISLLSIIMILPIAGIIYLIYLLIRVLRIYIRKNLWFSILGVSADFFEKAFFPK